MSFPSHVLATALHTINQKNRTKIPKPWNKEIKRRKKLLLFHVRFQPFSLQRSRIIALKSKEKFPWKVAEGRTAWMLTELQNNHAAGRCV